MRAGADGTTIDTLADRRVRFELDAENDFASIRSSTAFRTLGIVANVAFCYVANSQGRRFRKGDVPASEQREVIVLRAT